MAFDINDAPTTDAVTMEVLKFVVHEMAEEIGEEDTAGKECISHREPSEFTNEATIVVYRGSDVCPPDVLEEMNQADLPNKVRGVARAVREAAQREER